MVLGDQNVLVNDHFTRERLTGMLMKINSDIAGLFFNTTEDISAKRLPIHDLLSPFEHNNDDFSPQSPFYEARMHYQTLEIEPPTVNYASPEEMCLNFVRNCIKPVTITEIG
ncbi:uncharacterized protein [Clytia hemisphaerica]|uniref:uncharacterized protein isoform X2 n=1 Tax=Clytia hemisphaerica TaxID=252671 RepID=UPI0034D72FA2